MAWDAGNSTKSHTNYLLLGVTSGGRHSALIFTRRGDMLRPIGWLGDLDDLAQLAPLDAPGLGGILGL